MKDSVNLCSLIEQFGSEDRCRAYLEALRWPDEVLCPRCGSDKISQIVKRNQYDCDACRYQFSVTAGTVFNDSHLPLWKWFLCTYLLCESKKGMSANQLSRTLGISYKTAWYLCHRIRSAMKEANPEPLDGIVEIDETYVGGKHIGRGVQYARDRKEIVIGIKQRGGELRFFHAEDVKSGALAKYVKENISDSVEVESSFSLLKRGIIGSWHKVSAKHLPAYLDEMTFRFKNRDNPFLFRDTMMKLVEAPVLEYKKLTAA